MPPDNTGPRPGLDSLATEAADSANGDLDLLETAALVRLMNEADASVPAAVAAATSTITATIDGIVSRLAAGGRLVYAGAGTSGRLALLDAAEVSTTFGTPPGLVTAVIAGGADAVAAAQEAAEDDAEAGATDIRALSLSGLDTVVAISASGRTPYSLGAIRAAREVGALTVALVSTASSQLGAASELEIAVAVGPEVVAGSTRLKAGTAQKLVLNMISTITMIRLGKTYGNLMVDVVASNEKLRARVQRVVREATGVGDAEAVAALQAAGGSGKVAIVSLLAGVDVTEARARLERAGGFVREALAG
ncbi:MAG: N-acetylmuramic acid 6-phosphate etherase [Gaiellales bacterium]